MRYDQLPRTAHEAREFGIPFYFSGQLCKHGHVAPRYAINGLCVACTKARTRSGRNDPEMVAKEYVTKKIAGLPDTVRKKYIPDPQRQLKDAKEAFEHWDHLITEEKYDYDFEARELVTIRTYQVWGNYNDWRNDADDLVRSGHAKHWRKLNGGLHIIVLLLREYSKPQAPHADPRKGGHVL